MPAIIDAANDQTVGSDRDRDAIQSSINPIGKYNIQAVFAAYEQGRLSDLTLSDVMATFGPNDDHAIDALVIEMKKDDGLTFDSLSALGKIGPKAAPALPAIKEMLNDRNTLTQKHAAEAIAAIESHKPKDDPQANLQTAEATPTDIREMLKRGGYDTNADWSRHLSDYVRFGRVSLAEKYLRGDKFDKIEVEKETQNHREKLRTQTFRITGLKYRPFVRDDFETKGLTAEVRLPMRIRGEKPFYETPTAFRGLLGGLRPCELDTRFYRFMTKDGTLRACTPTEARYVEQNDGVLYHPEVSNTALVLVIQGKLEDLKQMARSAKDYSVEMDFSELHYGRPIAWGYYQKKAYEAAHLDCQKLWIDSLTDEDTDIPVYFPTALIDTDPDKIPECVWAQLNALRVVDKDGKVVGSYVPHTGELRDK